MKDHLKKMLLLIVAFLPTISIGLSIGPELECGDVENYYFQENCSGDLYEFKFQFQGSYNLFGTDRDGYGCSSIIVSEMKKDREIVRFDTFVEEVVGEETTHSNRRYLNVNKDVGFCNTGRKISILGTKKKSWLPGILIFILSVLLGYFGYKKFYNNNSE